MQDIPAALVGALGAVLGAAIAVAANWFLHGKQHERALELQKNQWEQDWEAREGQWEQDRIARETQWHWESAMRRDEWTNEQADRQAEWEHQRRDRLEQSEDNRRLEREREQREALRALQTVMPLFSRAARARFEHQQALLSAQREGKVPEELAPEQRLKLEAHVEQFNDMRSTVVTAISRVENEAVRKAANNLYGLDESMALSNPASWTESVEFYGGRSPIFLQVDWERQLLRMAGKLLRGDSIEDEVIEENVHRRES